MRIKNIMRYQTTRYLARLSFLSFIILLVLFVYLSLYKAPTIFTKNLNFVTSQKLASDSNMIKPFFESSFIPQPNCLLAAHSATLDLLPNGSLIALWFAGSHEGKPDVQIWQSYFESGIWSKAHPIVSRISLAQDMLMYIKKVGNPVIYRAVDNTLHLFVLSVSIGGWSGSSLNHLISLDNGVSWSKAKKIVLSPIFNISTLVRTSAITLSNGGFYLPVYHEAIRYYPEILYFDASGKFIKQLRINSYNRMIQPAIAIDSPTTAFAYFRNHINSDVTLYTQATHDTGKTWGKLVATNLYNKDSSIAVASLGDGRILMIRNIVNRNRLAISITRNGYYWKDIVYLEDSALDGEFSYPVIKVHNDIVDILYTWQRKYIKHVRFNTRWLNTKESEAL